MPEKSFIEYSFPVKQVSEESAREKNIRSGHISTLHIWWARRPLAASRATIYAALTSNSDTEQGRISKAAFIGDFAKWENSLNNYYVEKARKDILNNFEGDCPKVLDPFSGGGSIPLEALRLGCDTFASDLNPVAVIILNALLYFPQKYGQLMPASQKTELGTFEVRSNKLVEDITRWSDWLLKKVEREVKHLYPNEPDGSIVVGYIWARTIKCNNPNCKVAIPLMRQTWIAKKKRIALRITKAEKSLGYEIVEGNDIDFDPSQGTISRAKVICPLCGGGLSAKEVRKAFKDNKTDQEMVVVIMRNANKKGKRYRLATKDDVEIYKRASTEMIEKRSDLRKADGIDPIPTEEIPLMSGTFNVPIYGIDSWDKLFNDRQKLTIMTFMHYVNSAYLEMCKEGYKEEYAKGLTTYLALAVNMTIAFTNVLARWDNTSELVKHLYARQALPMLWDYVESNPLSGSSGSFMTGRDYYLKAIDHCSKSSSKHAEVKQSSALNLPYQDNYFDAVITDPPYYDSVPYADLSDFFYVWLKRSIGNLYPDLFATPLSPKAEEITEMSRWDPKRYSNKDKNYFESNILKSFKEFYRVLKPSGIVIIVFAHKSTDAWESIINALLRSGLYLTASWPINTEMKARLRAKESAALASSIYMVCRKRIKKETAYFNEIKPILEKRIHDKLDQFWNEGISGSDFFISAIGPAMEVFGSYEKVENYSGEEVTAKELMELIRSIVSEYALSKILKNVQLSGIDSDTRFYLLWRWAFNSAKIPFDEARKLGNAVGVELSEQWNKGVIKKDKEFIQVLGPKERGNKFLEQSKYLTMIDVLHLCLLRWDENQRQAIAEILEESGYINNNAFWQLAQSISEVLPAGDKEKQMLQGFLYGRDGFTSDKQGGQQKLF